jgi:hypothetical protein
MEMKRFFGTMIMTAFLMLSFYQAQAQTKQSDDLPKYEVGADFTSLSLNSGTTLPGLGGRFTYNLNRHVALEAAGYFFPGNCEFCNGETTGHVAEGLFGVKVGKRFKKWGIFAKARPGFASFSQGAFNVSPVSLTTGGGAIQCYGPNPNNPIPCFRIEHVRLTNPVLDLGGVLEFYPSRRIVVRFDGGDTMIRYTRHTYNSLFADPANPNSGIPILAPFTDPGRTRHSFQFMGGVGFRF